MNANLLCLGYINAISVNIDLMYSRLSNCCGGHGRNGEGVCCADTLRVALFLSR